jgi:hypothetical protein
VRPEDMQRHGAALAERVRREVNTSERLGVILRQHRRQRMLAFAVAAAAVIVLAVSAVLIFSTEEAPVVSEPTPTTVSSGLQALPVEVFMVLVGDYTVDTADGSCQGSGRLAGIGAGSLVHIWDESAYPSPEEAPTIALPEGLEVASDDPDASFLLSSGENTGCAFALPGLQHDIAEYEHISLFPESDPDVAISSRIIGQRVVVTFGVEPGEPAFDLAPGVASDVPEEWQAELQALWNSAGPGRIVGSVALWKGHHSALSSSQPFCVGAARYAGIQPGQSVVVTDGDGGTVGETILRGSAYDGHEGCVLWFVLDVPPDLEVYTIEIGDHPAVTFDLSVLEEFGWRVNLWSDDNQIQAVCVELEPKARPMTCVLLEPPPA